MNNADMPAMPNIEGTDINGDSYQHNEYTGLTKREHFAAMAMQGSLAGDVNNELTVEDIAIQARQCADALLKELSK